MNMRTTLMSACAGLFALGAASLPANAEHGRNAAIAGGAAAGLAAGAIAGGALASQSYYNGYYPGTSLCARPRLRRGLPCDQAPRLGGRLRLAVQTRGSVRLGPEI